MVQLVFRGLVVIILFPESFFNFYPEIGSEFIVQDYSSKISDSCALYQMLCSPIQLHRKLVINEGVFCEQTIGIEHELSYPAPVDLYVWILQRVTLYPVILFVYARYIIIPVLLL